jgi:hypothetical protein
MGQSKGLTGELFPTLAEIAARVTDGRRTAARLETLEILLDVEQVTDLLSSLDDLRQGNIVSMNSAFGDL